MKHLPAVETRSAPPLETREDPPADPLAQATAAVGELRAAVTDHQTRQTTELRGLTDRLAALETRMNRPGTVETTAEPAAETRAFAAFVRGGVERVPADEVRALTVSTDTAGGYLAPEQFVAELQRNLVLFSPIRAAARVATASSGEILLPKRTGTLTAAWTGETAASTGTEPTYGQQKIVVHELRCHVDVSNRLLEDAAFDIESELAYDLAEEFGRAEGAAFINGLGDASNQPKGLLTETVDGVTTAGASITGDELIDLYHALPGAYAARAVWAMNRTTIGAIRKLKTTAGDYLWREPISEGNPPTILGRPVIEFPDLPDADAEEIPVVFGDFGSGFRIFDRVNLSVLRDPYSQQANGLVRFHARRRVGGGMTKAEAFRFLTMAA
ncbi:phage major capsid protein [Frigidibacter oleivorans]|uniref:phage major capsid protein n=1 Tax=Frigidibacter oleivorans TaxID=2487129 RepID=UPI000F8E2310|nr:phage major capsid protein [Frigidibacter oleivorans]